jgi:transposase
MATKRYKRDFKEMELRRRKGMRMLARGMSQSDVARELAVSRQTASSWNRQLAQDPQAWRRKPLGRPGGMSDVPKRKLGKALLNGAVFNGFPNELWTLARIAKVIEREFGLKNNIKYFEAINLKIRKSAARPLNTKRKVFGGNFGGM